MERKLTLDEIRKIANSPDRPIKPKPIKIPEHVKKYDKIHLSQERTKRIMK